MQQQAFSLIEVLIALSIVAILTAFSAPMLQHFMARHEARMQQTKLLAAIATIRQEAKIQGIPLTLKVDPTIHWRGFPNTHTLPQFSPAGLTNNDNGTFWYCHQKVLMWTIVVNRSGQTHVSATPSGIC